MKISKTAEARVLCGLSVIFYPFIRLWFIIKEHFKRRKDYETSL
jgi:hypothetical protein